MGCRTTLEWTLVFGLETDLDHRDVSSENHVLHDVTISREADDERPNELLAKGRFPLHEAAGNLNGHIVRVVRHDVVYIRPAPRAIVRGHEGFDLGNGRTGKGSRHRSLFRSRAYQAGGTLLPRSQPEHGHPREEGTRLQTEQFGRSVGTAHPTARLRQGGGDCLALVVLH